MRKRGLNKAFLEVFNTMTMHNFLLKTPHAQRFCASKIIIIMSFVVLSVSIKKVDPTGDQVVGSNPAEVDNILSWRLIMKYFLQSFSPFR